MKKYSVEIMYLGEVYQSLVQGVIDGAENNWPSYESGRHFEVAKFYSLSRHVMAPEVLVMSLHRWQSLSETDQQHVLESAQESVALMTTLWDQRVENARRKIIAANGLINEVDNISDFSNLMKPVWSKFAKDERQMMLIEEIQSMRSYI